MKVVAVLFALIVFAASLWAQSFENGQSADKVIGAPDFQTPGGGGGANGFLQIGAVAIDPGTGKIFVSDIGSNRVLRFAANAGPGDSAEAVFGQADFDQNQPNRGNPVPAANSFNKPYGIHVDFFGTLWVADIENHRVLGFLAASSIPNNADPDADIVIGQSDFVSAGNGVSATKFNRPSYVFGDPAYRLWVSDSQNRRVLRFDDVYSTDLVAARTADGVLGQFGFDDNSGNPVGPEVIGNPHDIFLDANGRLWVADSGFNRVLRFDDAAGKPNTKPDADGVLGQPDFTSGAPDVTATSLANPASVRGLADGSVVVADLNNRRLLIYSAASALSDGPPASVVLGQENFTSFASMISANRFSSLGPIAVDASGRIWAADQGAQRALRFSAVTAEPGDDADSNPPTLSVRGRKRVVTDRPIARLRGTASDDRGVAAVRYKATGTRLRNARGTERWQVGVRVKKNRVVVRLFAVDTAGNRSVPVRVRIVRR